MVAYKSGILAAPGGAPDTNQSTQSSRLTKRWKLLLRRPRRDREVEGRRLDLLTKVVMSSTA